jgi:hypothetical protein
MLAMSRGDYFQPLAVSQTYGLLIVNPTATTEWPLEPHWHYFANGTRQPGTFVGWNNYTTWAFLQGNMFKAHRIRLLTDPAQALRPLEIAGFITAVPYGLSLED